jgi:fatty-acyl-CoA synthase
MTADEITSACWTLPDHVDQAARRWPDTEALVYGQNRLTFADFAERTRRVGAGLRGIGVEPGDAVGVLMPNGVDSLATTYGASRAGAVPVPINGRYKARELAYVIAHAGVRVLIASPDYDELLEGVDARRPTWDELLAAADKVEANKLDRLQERISVRDVAMLMYTSGTTSQPKGCRLSHEALVRTGRVFGLERFPMRHGDRMWNPLPLFHLATILPFNGCLATGATFVGMHRFDAGEALTLLEEEHCTTAFPAFDLIWAAVLDHPAFASADLSALRLVNVNGVPERLREMAARTPRLIQISPYGATEGGGVIALSHLDDPLELRVGSAGRPFAGIEVRAVEPETGAPLGPGERGEVTYRGWSLFDGYHADPEQTAAAIDQQGFFHSGDLGSVDADGRVTFIGRLKDMLKVGGENVAAAEIEGFLGQHPAIAEVQVVAAPDERYGEVPCAFVALRPGAELTQEELIEHCLGRIATFKVPRYLRVVEEWPLSGTKIQKFRLREAIARELEAAGIRSAPKLERRQTTCH